jgi:hypothetical protein
MANEMRVKKRGMTASLLWGVLALGVGAAAGAFAMVDVVGAKVHRAQAVNEARSIADMADNVGTWASTYKGVWIKDDGLTAKGVDIGSRIDTQRYKQSSEETDPHGVFDTYHRKNPALIQRELSDVIQKSDSRGKFRLTSDKYMNPVNAPDGFDLRAMQALRQNGQREFYEIKSGEMRYARRLVAKDSCMNCHDTPDKAPSTIARLYPGPQGYGYVKGDLAGIISVRVPYVYDRSVVLDNL